MGFKKLAWLAYLSATIAPILCSEDSTLPMPRWLRDITAMTEWPLGDPPYIPVDYLELGQVPMVPVHGEGECDAIREEDCSFDCRICVARDDVASCSRLSQSFDDGPTPATLDLLKRLKNKTTFFTLGVQIVQYPEIFRRQKNAGHLLGSHTWNHRRLTELNNQEIAAQLLWTMWAMNATAGIVPRFFRPPYGAVDERIRNIAKQLGLITVLWDRDTEDWRLNDGSLTHENITDVARGWSKGRPPQGLILEHDTTPATVEAAIAINRRLRRQKTVADCFGTTQWYQN